MPTKKLAFWLVLALAGSTFALTMGARQTMGLFLSGINTSTNLGVGSISLAFAFGQLWWGLTQPFAGAMADKHGSGRVIFIGICLVALGTFLTPFMQSTWGLILTIGVLAAGGAGMAGPAVLMATATRMVPAEKRGITTGIVNAGGSFGQFLMAPLAGLLIGEFGWMTAMQVMGVIVLLALPASYMLSGSPTLSTSTSTSTSTAAAKPLSTREAIKEAFNLPSYWMLCAGFFVCGFHIAFLATHLPGVIAMCGLPSEYGAWSLAMIGLFNIVGSIGMGWAVGRWRMKSLLSLVYALRGLGVLAFLLAPKTGTVMLLFAALMGLTFLSTVPPTVGLVAKFFGPSNMATLYGIVMVVHQIGGFLGAWLGGKVVDATGNYDWMWYVDILLALGAALIHLPIKEAKLARATA